jgi:hypothetical protein
MVISSTPTATGAPRRPPISTEAQDPADTTKSTEKIKFDQYYPGGVLQQLIDVFGLQQQTPPAQPTDPTK